MIGRCEADPETSVIRTMSFEVDFDDFTVRSCEGCPPQFLDLAKACCQVSPPCCPVVRTDVKSARCAALVFLGWHINTCHAVYPDTGYAQNMQVCVCVWVCG